MKPDELLEHLIDRGFDPKEHRGRINLMSCLSSTADAVGWQFADTFCFWLRHNGFDNEVIGYDGNVHVEGDGTISLIPPWNLGYYDELAKERTAVQTEFRELGEIYRTKLASADAMQPAPRSLDDLDRPETPQERRYEAAVRAAKAVGDDLDALKDQLNAINAEVNSLFVPAGDLRKVAVPRVIFTEKIYADGDVEKYDVRSRPEVAEMERRNFIRQLAEKDPHWSGRKGAEWQKFVRTHTETPSYIG